MKYFSIPLLAIISLTLTACSVPTESSESESVSTPSFDQDSWKTLIPESCSSYFDGCNNCNKAEGSDIAACTRKFCQAYQEPKCLDEALVNPDETEAPSRGTKVSYECSEGNTFTVSYEEHVAGDIIIKLEDDQVMMSDAQDRTAYLMTRVISASGEKFEGDDGRIFWAEGSEATVLRNDGEETVLYSGCNIVE